MAVSVKVNEKDSIFCLWGMPLLYNRSSGKSTWF
jgi:hypothetical protein